VVSADVAPYVTVEADDVSGPSEPTTSLEALALVDGRTVSLPVVPEADASEPETMVEALVDAQVDASGALARLRWARSEEEEAVLLAQLDERTNGNGTRANDVPGARVADERPRPRLEDPHELRRT
jgi:hypothetical protein